jgi:hypothetical protein
MIAKSLQPTDARALVLSANGHLDRII